MKLSQVWSDYGTGAGKMGVRELRSSGRTTEYEAYLQAMGFTKERDGVIKLMDQESR